VKRSGSGMPYAPSGRNRKRKEEEENIFLG
jgi:hypothetical protein